MATTTRTRTTTHTKTKTRAHIGIVVDRSGSMYKTKTEAEGGLKHYLEEQAKIDKIDNVDLTVALYQFDTVYEKVYGPLPIADRPDYTLHPRGNTALYDAIGKVLDDTDEVYRDHATAPRKVVVVIVTDGDENSSREYSFDAVNAKIADCKAKGWEIVFLAGHPKAVEIGRALHMNTYAYDPRVKGATMDAYAASSVGTQSFLSGESDSVDLASFKPVDDDTTNP